MACWSRYFVKKERQPKTRIWKSSFRMSFFSACGMSAGYHLAFVRNRSHGPSCSVGMDWRG